MPSKLENSIEKVQKSDLALGLNHTKSNLTNQSYAEIKSS